MMMPSNSEPEAIAQTENFVIWMVQDADGEPLYHLDINNLVIRFFTEEWDEFKTFAAKFAKIRRRTPMVLLPRRRFTTPAWKRPRTAIRCTRST